jgi:hypothetical protein
VARIVADAYVGKNEHGQDRRKPLIASPSYADVDRTLCFCPALAPAGRWRSGAS